MSASSAPQHHADAASRVGIVPGYWDIQGQWHETDPATRQAIVSAVGEAPHGPPRTYVLNRARRPWTVATPPPAAGAEAAALVLTLEDGSTRELAFNPADLDDTGLALALPDDLPLGYHRLHWRGEDGDAFQHLIVCPEQGYFPPSLAEGGRRAGVAVSLYGVHTARTWGCGDFTALRGIVDWVVEDTGGDYIALNPLHAIHNRQPYNTSPYLPNSLYYRNLIYLDIDAVEDIARSPEAQTLRADPAVQAEIAALNASEFVEYERVQDLKLRFLRLAFARFRTEDLARGTARGKIFESFVGEEGDLLTDYALYCALDEVLHARHPDWWIWQHWPEALQQPGTPEVRQFARDHAGLILFYKYIQWQLDVQAAAVQAYAKERGMEIGLFHDLPLATDKCGAELWAHRKFYVNGCRVGSPPDAFAPEGQDWSFPPPNREAHRADGYRLFAETIRKSARHGGALRMDHVMRLFRLFWMPDGAGPAQGTYVRDFPEDLLGVLALESVRHQLLIIGEDLGTVEPEQRSALQDHGILSYRLFYFERNGDGSFKRPADYPPQALVSSTTHDLPTLAGFWAGHDIDARRSLGLIADDAGAAAWHASRRGEKRQMLERLIEQGLLPAGYPLAAADGPELTGEIHNAIIGFLAHTPSMLMTLNHEDLTKELDQQNMPGTTWQYPNWRRKMRYSVEALRTNQQARDFARMFHNWLTATQRHG
ncbi:MAG: 4-alpha-glucanotransferase [Bryobacterales bacterium]|nr:4-alpha-glucanotransferase [Bryobacterales bacterium]